MGIHTIGTSKNKPATKRNSDGTAQRTDTTDPISDKPIGNKSTVDATVAGDADTGDAVDNSAIDPSSIADSSGGDAPFGRFSNGKARKRPRSGVATGTSSRKTATEISTFVGDILYSGHEILAKISKMDELELSEDEAKQLGAGIVRVTEQYDVPLPSEKAMAWFNLAKVCASVYGPRIAAINLRKNNEKKKSPVLMAL